MRLEDVKVNGKVERARGTGAEKKGRDGGRGWRGVLEAEEVLEVEVLEVEILEVEVLEVKVLEVGVLEAQMSG